ncbi:MAG: YraN family protein [Butyrivibrio sp.]
MGNLYERKAALFLQNKGYKILRTNYYTRFGEIDIIARDGKYLVFCEVKYRTGTDFGYPEEAVNSRKRFHIKSSALRFMQEMQIPADSYVRFDIISILGDRIKHIKNAF